MNIYKQKKYLKKGEGGGAKQYKSSFHAAATIVKTEGITGIYAGYKLRNFKLLNLPYLFI